MHDSRRIIISNELLQNEKFYTEFVHDYTMPDFGLLFALLARVNPRETVKPCKAAITELCADIGFTGANRRSAVKKKLKALADKSSMYFFDEKEKADKLKRLFVEDANNKELELSISKDAINYCIHPLFTKYFCSQRERFTMFPEYIPSRIASPLAMKLYMYLHSWANVNNGYHSIAANKLARMLLKDDAQTTLHEFKRAIAKAVEEITRETDIGIEDVRFDAKQAQRGTGQKLAKNEDSAITFIFGAGNAMPEYLSADGMPSKNHRARKREETQNKKNEIALMIIADELEVIPEVLECIAERDGDEGTNQVVAMINNGYQAKRDAAPGYQMYKAVNGSMVKIPAKTIDEALDELLKIKIRLAR